MNNVNNVSASRGHQRLVTDGPSEFELDWLLIFEFTRDSKMKA